MRRRSILLIAQGSSALVVVALVAAAVASTGAQESEPRVARERLRVVSYNIRHGAGMDGRVDLDRIAEVITRLRPDLVALQEIDRGTERTDRVDQAVALGRASGLEARFGAFMSYQGGEYGMAVLSRWPILETRNHRLPDGDEPRTALTVAVRSPRGTELVFGGIHLYRTEAERLAQAQQLFDALADESRPLILAGDFNSRPRLPRARPSRPPLVDSRQGSRSANVPVGRSGPRDRFRDAGAAKPFPCCRAACRRRAGGVGSSAAVRRARAAMTVRGLSSSRRMGR